MNIPEASSKRGFDWGFATGVDYFGVPQAL
jgi:hypothetical protein